MGIGNMIEVTGYCFDLLASPHLDRVIQYQNPCTALVQRMLLINSSGHLHIEFPPVDVLTLERVIQNILTGMAEHTNSLTSKHRYRGNVDPSPQQQEKDDVDNIGTAAFAETRSVNQRTKPQLLPGIGK